MLSLFKKEMRGQHNKSKGFNYGFIEYDDPGDPVTRQKKTIRTKCSRCIVLQAAKDPNWIITAVNIIQSITVTRQSLHSAAVLQTLQIPNLYDVERARAGQQLPGSSLTWNGDRYIQYEFCILGLFWTVLWSVKGSWLAMYWCARTKVQVLTQTSKELTALRTLHPSHTRLPRKATKKAAQKAAKFERRSWSRVSRLEEGIAEMNGHGLWASKPDTSKASGSIYHGSRASFDSPCTATIALQSFNCC